MDEPRSPEPHADSSDPVLEAAGARLRARTKAISPTAVEVAALRRRTQRLGVAAAASVVVVALLGGLLIRHQVVGGDGGGDLASGGRTGAPPSGDVERFLSSLDAQPVDPTKVQLVSTVSTFADCDALVGDLRRVGAEHVGSRGFGGFSGGPYGAGAGWAMRASSSFDTGAEMAAPSPAEVDKTTLGTNVQVSGVDELDFVKAAGTLIYDLDGKGNLRITDAEALAVLSTLDVTPSGSGDEDGQGDPYGGMGPYGGAHVSELLVAEGRVAIFGSEVEVSEPVEGDPSATRASTSYLTVTFVDATDPAAPEITDRVRVEGSLVSARLIDGEIRLVTTSHMADLGFVMPTTPASVVKALEQNRRSVASSTAADWIPDWEREGEDPYPLVPCDRVHVPDTFSGVAMTSMVTLPIGTGRFEPSGTSILAPGTTLYAGLEKVAISSEVWVDPVDRDRLRFEDWQTAIHEFSFATDAPPAYEGSGIVDGSTIGQFAFGEIGDSLAVVTTEGTPWGQDPKGGVDLTVLTPDGDGELAVTAKVDDLADGRGEVSAVRFVEGRVLISTGLFGRVVHVIDVTVPGEPRRAGSVDLPGPVGYFHPLPDGQALVVGSRFDWVGEGDDRVGRSWVQVQLLDVTDADAPQILSSWERPWASDDVGADHHAFTYWPDRQLAMWGVHDARWSGNQPRPNHAVVLGVGEGLGEVAVPEASQPDEVAAPCPEVEVTDAEIRQMIGASGRLLRCDDPGTREVDWPRYQCYRVDDRTVATYAPEETGGAFFVCSPAPQPRVARVLVVAGTPMLMTDQTLERLDPDTFGSTSILYHPTGLAYGF